MKGRHSYTNVTQSVLGSGSHHQEAGEDGGWHSSWRSLPPFHLVWNASPWDGANRIQRQGSLSLKLNVFENTIPREPISVSTAVLNPVDSEDWPAHLLLHSVIAVGVLGWRRQEASSVVDKG